MAASPDISVAVLVAAPFIAALLAPLLCRVMGRYAAWVLALAPAAIFVFLVTLIPSVAAGEVVRARYDWAPAFGIDLSFAIDGLSIAFALTISGIGALIVLYSGAYLEGHPHLGRFLGFMLGFMGVMQGLVLADSLIALYAFWELTAVASFLLIGFDHSRMVARRAAFQALIVTSAGGLCLLLGALLLQQVTGQWDLGAMAGQGPTIAGSFLLLPICFLIFIAAFTKSAQVPFHFWLPNAMEAPTPVSAYLHSATMVQAGIYLLARLSPLLGGTPVWTTTLVIFGGATMVWGSIGALKQTDLKQMLAQSTIASLGVLVLLLGFGGETATIAAIVYFLAHALYKAGFFLIAGLIDHETGSRDITALGGLRDKMAASFIAAILAGVSMLGLPPALGYLAKEEMYGVPGPLQWLEIVALLAGNTALGALAIALVARPFMGPLIPTPKPPHEGPVAMLAGPLILGILGIAAAVLIGWTATQLIVPAATVLAGHPVDNHLGFRLDLADPAIWLSLATWALSALIYWRLDTVRTTLRRLDSLLGWTADTVFDLAMAGLLRLAHGFASTWQNGRLRFYLLVIFLGLAAALILPLVILGGLSWSLISPDLRPPEWGVFALAIIGLAAVVFAPNLLVGILALGVQGLAIALLYLLFGAPDLSFTQFMVETLSVVMFALVMIRLRLDTHERRTVPAALRDGGLALLCGGGVTAVLLAILAKPFDDRLGAFFAANAVPLAHGRNIVNVILVDFRGLDTLGEISVVLTAGIGVFILIATARRVLPTETTSLAKPRRTRRPRAAKPAPEAAP